MTGFERTAPSSPVPQAAEVTTVICARNAAATIERAIRSAVAQGGPVLLLDDGSEDDTVVRARGAGGGVLEVVRPATHRTLGYARQRAIEAVTTPWLQWLDADDELIPGRATRLVTRAAGEGLDAVWDAAELFDGATGSFIRHLPMPAFMCREQAAVRLFERNHAPGPAWPLVRTAVARAIGYDAALPTADDLDFMLRGLRAGARWGFEAACGYRQYAYPSSLSRARRHQRHWVAEVLRKHRYEDVRALYRAAGIDSRITSWGLVSMAVFREDWRAALALLHEIEPVHDPSAVIEPDGPWPFEEGWRQAFVLGTLHLLAGEDHPALEALERAEALRSTAEGSNNLGVALSRAGRVVSAAACFARAEALFPGYADARENARATLPTAITPLPLRRTPSRHEYAA